MGDREANGERKAALKTSVESVELHCIKRTVCMDDLESQTVSVLEVESHEGLALVYRVSTCAVPI